MKVNSYSFGRIVVDGREYTNDVIISWNDIVNSRWWRKEGHNVCLEDVKEIFELKPEIVVFGTGYNGLMRVEKEVVEALKKKGVEVIEEKTEDAVARFNALVRNGRRAVLAAHLTC
ncbi:MAG: hypothetical protein DRP11_05295 [Candidatus Aenigmatarchaeota archaeon]|nr:MAG: hypothetical protein DRP11_05295 [Candidatus Aenigmarchaeota archaeon]